MRLKFPLNQNELNKINAEGYNKRGLAYKDKEGEYWSKAIWNKAIKCFTKGLKSME